MRLREGAAMTGVERRTVWRRQGVAAWGMLVRKGWLGGSRRGNAWGGKGRECAGGAVWGRHGLCCTRRADGGGRRGKGRSGGEQGLGMGARYGGGRMALRGGPQDGLVGTVTDAEGGAREYAEGCCRPAL